MKYRCNHCNQYADGPVACCNRYDGNVYEDTAYTPAPDSERTVVSDIQKLVDKQAEDEGLWFEAMTAPEDYLQRHLRELHAAIEKEPLYTIEAVIKMVMEHPALTIVDHYGLRVKPKFSHRGFPALPDAQEIVEMLEDAVID